MSDKDDTTKLLNIQELIVFGLEIKEDEVILICKNRFDYGMCPVSFRRVTEEQNCDNISNSLHENTIKRIRDVPLL